MKTMYRLPTDILLHDISDLTRVSPPVRRTIMVEAKKDSRLVFLTEPTGLAVEQYKMLRRRLQHRRPEGGVLLITSPGPSEGKTLTSINLAWCLADSGESTCLVDFDFRAAGVGETLGCSFASDGVEDALSGERKIADVLCQLGDRPLTVMGVKERSVSSSKILVPKRIAAFLAELRSMFQWVVLDLPPAVPFADVAEVLPYVDGALLVVRAGKTQKQLVAAPAAILGAKLWGAVLNDVPVEGSSYYGYYGAGD